MNIMKYLNFSSIFVGITFCIILCLDYANTIPKVYIWNVFAFALFILVCEFIILKLIVKFYFFLKKRCE